MNSPLVPVAATPELIAALEAASKVLNGQRINRIEVDALRLQLQLARLHVERKEAA